MSKPRIAVLRDFSYDERPGEEELAIKRFLLSGKDRVIAHVIPPAFISENDTFENDDIVLAFGLKLYPEYVFERLLNHPCVVHVAQDWWEPTQPNTKYRNDLIRHVAITIFSSPSHRERYLRIHGLEDMLPSTCVIPFPLLPEDCRSHEPELGLETEQAYLWCAPWHPDYGNDIMVRWAERNRIQVHACGLRVPRGEIAPNVVGMGAVALDAAAATFLQYQKLVFFPRTPVPFGFAFLLAYRLGLDLTWSNEIGCLSYRDSPQDDLSGVIEHCHEAQELFWNAVAEIIA